MAEMKRRIAVGMGVGAVVVLAFAWTAAAGDSESEARHVRSNTEGRKDPIAQTNQGFARPELKLAAERVVDSDEAGLAGIATVEVRADLSGLDINVTGGSPAQSMQERIASIAALPAVAIAYIPNSGLVNLG